MAGELGMFAFSVKAVVQSGGSRLLWEVGGRFVWGEYGWVCLGALLENRQQ